MMRPAGDLVFIGDVHLEPGDETLPDFLGLLASLRRGTSRIVLLGDLFDLWIGDPALEGSHHVAVTEALKNLRAAGIVVRYIEGNRDYRIGRRHGGSAFDAVSEQGFEDRFGGRRIWSSHGDLVNPADRQYRAWRSFSRSAAVWGCFQALPSRWRAWLAASLERKLRSTNVEFKRQFPDEQVRAYASRCHSRGFGVVVLGHFHVERDLAAAADGARILVLPEWKGSRRHLRLTPAGEIAFVGSSA